MRHALLFLLVLCGCGSVSFEVEQELQKQTIQGDPLRGVLASALLPNPYTLNIDIRAEVAKRGTGPATRAFLKSLELEIAPETPDTNFDFIDETRLFVEGPNLAKVEIARLVPVPNGLKKLQFEIVPMVDLLPYINAGATISATATGTRPAKNTTFFGKVVVEVRI